MVGGGSLFFSFVHSFTLALYLVLHFAYVHNSSRFSYLIGLCFSNMILYKRATDT